jgi:hypothetical protein
VAAYPHNDDHLATLAGYELAPHRVAAVMERLDAVAKAAKAGGDERSMDQLRADCFLDLLSGEGIAAGGPITDGTLSVGIPEPDPRDTEAEQMPWPQEPAGIEPDAEPPAETDPPVDPAGVVDLWAFGIDQPPSDDPGQDHGPSWQELTEQRRWLAEFDRLPVARPATRCVLCGHVDGPPAAAGPLPAPRPGSVDIVVSLETLLGLSEIPAELAGFGPVVAEVARQVVAEIPESQWRFSVYDRMRELAYHGTGRPRRLAGRATARSPNARLAAFIRARDRTCIAPGCRRPARRCDIDHSLAWVKGGETVHCNLGVLCKLHHRFKHATGSELEQPISGVFLWRTPAGMYYQTRSAYPLLDADDVVGLPEPGG